MDRATGRMVREALNHALQSQTHERVVQKHHQRTLWRLKSDRIHGLKLDANPRMPQSECLKVSFGQGRQIAGHFDSDQLAKSSQDTHGQSPTFPTTVVHKRRVRTQLRRQPVQDLQRQSRIDPLILHSIGYPKLRLAGFMPDFLRKECRQTVSTIKRPLGDELTHPSVDPLSPQSSKGEHRVFSDHPERSFGGNNPHMNKTVLPMRPRGFIGVTFPSH